MPPRKPSSKPKTRTRVVKPQSPRDKPDVAPASLPPVPEPVAPVAKSRRTPAAPVAAVREPAPAPPVSVAPSGLNDSLTRAFLTNERVNQVLLDFINPRLWRVHPPSSRGRNIATSFAHIHNVRCMHMRMAARSVVVPESLDRSAASIDEARWSLGASARAMTALIEEACGHGGQVRGMRLDVLTFVVQSVAHEAHHRGQICQWLRELGAPLSPEQQLALWSWDKRLREVRGPTEQR
ncbi:MAG: DinB family protein [Gemmatimonadaceae bacterium]